MLQLISKNIFRLFILVLLQVLVIDHFRMGGIDVYVNPFIYILFLVLLPFQTPRWALLLIGFGLGLIIDSFQNTQGIHASACVLLAFIQPYVQNLLAPRDGYNFNAQPTLQNMGFVWFLTYSSIMITAHHLWLFGIESFRFSGIGMLLAKVILSSIATFILFVLYQYISFKPEKK